MRIICLFNLKPGADAKAYEAWARETDSPGVSALNPAGWTVRDAEAWVRACGADPRVRCFDIMELNPAHDPDGRTARVAAHLFLTFLASFAQR